MPSVFFQTFGCQMNVADSDEMYRLLQGRGFTKCGSPESADLIIVNTCSVRENAEQRALRRIRDFTALKAKHPGMQLWVIGCMAERMGGTLAKKVSGVDRVIGARSFEDIGSVLDKLPGETATAAELFPLSGVSTFVPVMRGCNNFCSYCIVPYVRGPEQSIPASDIEQDIRKRAGAGIKEVVLLGQNVNSYNDRGLDFPGLLHRVSAVSGIERIRFTTSHPKDLTENLLKELADNPKMCRHVHLPVQSGSDRILALMNRNYTSAHYLHLVDMIRDFLPDADITTDLIVGFPSESNEDFQATLDLVEKACFTTAFMFAYSVREGTGASKMNDDVPQKVKIERLSHLVEIQTDITKKRYASHVGKELRVLFTGRQEKRDAMWMGQDIGCKRVLLACDDDLTGTILPVKAVRSSGMTLVCERTI
jgi:tRNA-2-methylthio-N6-dimethylallyladenosine synthase